MKPKIRIRNQSNELKEETFSTLFNKINDTYHNVSSDLYSKYGSFPIIDQSQQFIIGYTDKVQPIIPQKGIIIFGDHTRELKYVDFPFCTGADGTQILSVKTNDNPLFLYFYCKSLNIPNTGYNRHLKYLKEAKFFIPTSLNEQKSIADFFLNYDRWINESKSYIDRLHQIKSACLQSMFPQEGESVPKVRFKGFEKEWIKVEFGNLLDECFEKSKTENEDILLSSAINGLFLNSELFGHQRGKSNIGYRKIKKNMLILSAQNLHLGNANVNLRFEHGLVSPAYKIYYLRNVNPLFMHQWIKRDSTKTFFLNATTAGASLCRKNIVWEDLYRQTLLVPSLEEQEHIGRFFINLDKQISLQTQRLEKLKQIKSACLDKMFV